MTPKHLAVLAAVLIGGCSKETSAPTGAEMPLADALVVIPANGESSARLDATITLLFAKPVEQSVVERGFHLVSEKSIADSLCADSMATGHEGMMNTMDDSTMMQHLGRHHSTPGTFTWNADSTRCTFKPDSLLTSRTSYMIHIDHEATQMMERRLGDMSTMRSHGSGMMGNEMMFYFFTLDTANVSDGHSEHH